jgi:hypothetical protein
MNQHQEGDEQHDEDGDHAGENSAGVSPLRGPKYRNGIGDRLDPRHGRRSGGEGPQDE